MKPWWNPNQSARSKAIRRGGRVRSLVRKAALESLEPRLLLAIITVNTTGDENTSSTTLSLRQAIEVSDGTLAVSALSTQQQSQISGAVGSSNTIDFDIPQSDSGYSPTTGVWTFSITSPVLPTVQTNAAIINGYSQPGASPDTLAQGDNAAVLIDLSGSGGGIGLTIDASGSQVSGLAISHFGEGIELDSGGSVVTGDFIGTDPTGEIAEGNGVGIQISSSDNTIGGTAPADRNIVSGSTSSHGNISDYISNTTGPSGNLIEGNYVGTDATGKIALANASWGILDSGTNDTIGGLVAGAGNLISGNGTNGIGAIFGSITIEGNVIGTDVTGNVALGNGGGRTGINMQLNSFAAAGATTISDNVVSGNSAGGIYVDTASNTAQQSTFLVEGNLIGTNAAGDQVVGNGGEGLVMTNNVNSSITGNVASGNLQSGILVSGDSSNVVIQGNFVGTDKTGTLNLGNQNVGVIIEGRGSADANTTIGGSAAGAGNLIAFNGVGPAAGGGVQVSAATGVLISRNSIFANLGPGISSSTPPPPVLAFQTDPSTPGSGTLSGTLSAAANTAYTIEIFSNPTVPTSGDEQGKTYVTSVSVTTGASGMGSFSVTEPTSIYTATATDPDNNTSNFSTVPSVALTPPLATTLASSGVTTNAATLSASVNPEGSATTVTFVYGTDPTLLTGTTTTTGQAIGSGTSTVAVTTPLTGLQPGTTYYDEVVATSAGGTTRGAIVSFTTDTPPAATTQASSEVTNTAGTLSASVNPHGSATMVVFVYGTDPTLSTGTTTTSAQAIGSGTSAVALTAALTGLQPGTTYYDEVMATSAGGTTQGAIVSFTTLAPPAATTQASSEVTTAAGTLTASVNPEGSATTVMFVYGTDPTLSTGTTTTSAQAIGGGTSGVAVTAAVTGLQPGTTYYDEVVTTSAGGTTRGTIVSFTTPAPSTAATKLVVTTEPSGSVNAGSTFSLTISAEDGSGSVEKSYTGSVVLVLASGKGMLGGTTTVPVVDGVATFTGLTLSAAGTYSIEATSGQSVPATATPITVSAAAVPIDGPKVISVLRYGYHMMPTTLVLSFDQALDAITAEDDANYRIIGPSGRVIGIRSAVYDPATLTVTLHPIGRINIHHTYELIVDGTAPHGLTNTSGELLDGADRGQPDSDYRASLTWRNLVLDPPRPKTSSK